MKLQAWLSFVLVGIGAVVLGGCPIYPEAQGQRVCLQSGECYSCPYDYYSADCYAYACGSSYDCPSGTTCDYNGGYGTCVGGGRSGGVPDATAPGSPCSRPADCAPPSNCGADGQCHAGDCSNTGCPSGYQCKLSGGALACVPLGRLPDGGSSGGDGGDGGPPYVGCHNDAECSAKTPGAKCLDGACVAPADQCFDTTQCPANEQCVQGVCTPGCGAGQPPCPTGFACDPKTNVCSGNPSPCGATADGGACPSPTVCVEDHCVAQCGPTSQCPNGQVCVNGGCIPDQKPTFTCAQEGVVGPPCANGSVCIHHSCYIACNPDAGVTCQAADRFNQCKAVTTGSGTYSVCGSSTNLGSDCNPTQGKLCAGAGVCIDGFCR